METFKAIVVKEQDGRIVHSIDDITVDQLSEGEVLIKVAYSSVNFKDALAVKAGGGVIRNYPMIPGIDLSGTVVSSGVSAFQPGQAVLVTGFQIGMTHTGGFSEYARVPAEWIVTLPAGLSLKDVMVIGTAGFTAALSIIALENMGMDARENLEILVTGASGGVGSIAIQLLAKSGYRNIYALSRKPHEEQRLKAIGAKAVIHPDSILAERTKPLAKQKFHFVLDTVGGEIAAALISQIYYGGSISLCGNAGGVQLATTVLPFILRGVNMLGIDSVNFPAGKRYGIWARFADQWRIMDESLVNEVELSGLTDIFEQLQKGTHVGRTIVKIGRA